MTVCLVSINGIRTTRKTFSSKERRPPNRLPISNRQTTGFPRSPPRILLQAQQTPLVCGPCQPSRIRKNLPSPQSGSAINPANRGNSMVVLPRFDGHLWWYCPSGLFRRSCWDFVQLFAKENRATVTEGITQQRLGLKRKAEGAGRKAEGAGRRTSPPKVSSLTRPFTRPWRRAPEQSYRPLGPP